MSGKSSNMWMLSYKSLHEMTGRSRPQEIMNYKLALQLYKTINNQTPSRDWVNLNFKTILTSRTTTFSINKSNQRRVGMNILSNRFWYLNGKIKLDWMNLSFDTFKIKCKKLLLWEKPELKPLLPAIQTFIEDITYSNCGNNVTNFP